MSPRRTTRTAAVVTGAARGLGIARALAADGSQVALADLDADACRREADRLRDDGHEALAWTFDVADADAWAALRAEVDRPGHPEAARNVTGEVLHLDGGLHAFGDVRWVHHADAP